MIKKRCHHLPTLSVSLLVFTLPFLTACGGTFEVDLERTALPAHVATAKPSNLPTPRSTITPLPLQPTASPTSTPLPDPSSYSDDVVAIPFGLVYWTTDGLWHVNADGESVLIFDHPGTISPNGTQILYYEADDIWLADIATGERRNLTQTPDRFERCVQWWPGQSEIILFSSGPIPETEGLWGLGFSTVVRLDGSGYQVLDENRVVAGCPAPSPDGQTVAYNRLYEPWLYRNFTGPEPFEFDLTPYDPVSVPHLEFISPSWSPDGTRLAWLVAGDFAAFGGWRIAIGVFDLETRTALLWHPYEMAGMDSWPSAPGWSPDGQWLNFYAYDLDIDGMGGWVVRVDGQEEYYLGRYSRSPVWSPDGHWLVCRCAPQGLEWGVWLVEVGTWNLYSLDLPSDAYLVDWIDQPGN